MSVSVHLSWVFLKNKNYLPHTGIVRVQFRASPTGLRALRISSLTKSSNAKFKSTMALKKRLFFKSVDTSIDLMAA